MIEKEISQNAYFIHRMPPSFYIFYWLYRDKRDDKLIVKVLAFVSQSHRFISKSRNSNFHCWYFLQGFVPLRQKTNPSGLNINFVIKVIKFSSKFWSILLKFQKLSANRNFLVCFFLAEIISQCLKTKPNDLTSPRSRK